MNNLGKNKVLKEKKKKKIALLKIPRLFKEFSEVIEGIFPGYLRNFPKLFKEFSEVIQGPKLLKEFS